MSTSNSEFAKTLNIAPHLQEQAAAFADAKGLSLAARDVVAEERGGKLMAIVTSDAAMALALKAGRNFAPISTEFTADGSEWCDVWLQQKPPAACRVSFEVEGVDALVRVTHTWAEYTQGRVTGTQRTMPALMLAKATMQLGLRRIAPAAMAGLYSPEEAEAADSGEIAQAEHRAAVAEGFVPEQDTEAKGSKISRAEQYLARREELVRTGKALRAEVGDDAAKSLAAFLGAQQLDVNKLAAAQLKAVLAESKRIRDEVAATPAPAPEPVAPPVQVEATPEAVNEFAAAMDAQDAEFVI